ncbi:hypothetical protein D1815_02285 [Aquimarina sp. AD1]|nr:hypothetical protein [Aquimarina sp. AD1]AXT54635.1 hypothetical protein D1815_02285 [Aquimarina sp. AD1]
MDHYICVAGLLCFILGLVHSILGEVLIFRNLSKSKKIIPTIATSKLKVKHFRIIWATWHLTSLFGWCIGAILLMVATKYNIQTNELFQFILTSTTITMFCSSLLVFIATKGKHLGWVILLIIGILTLLEILK